MPLSVVDGRLPHMMRTRRWTSTRDGCRPGNHLGCPTTLSGSAVQTASREPVPANQLIAIVIM